MLIHPAGLAGSVVTGPVLKSFHAEGVAFFNSMRTPAALLAAAAIKVTTEVLPGPRTAAVGRGDSCLSGSSEESSPKCKGM